MNKTHIVFYRHIFYFRKDHNNFLETNITAKLLYVLIKVCMACMLIIFADIFIVHCQLFWRLLFFRCGLSRAHSKRLQEGNLLVLCKILFKDINFLFKTVNQDNYVKMYIMNISYNIVFDELF
jgi:hypothetical protein